MRRRRRLRPRRFGHDRVAAACLVDGERGEGGDPGDGANGAETVLQNMSPKLQTAAHTIAAWFTQSGSSPAAGVKILVILLIPLMFILRGLTSLHLEFTAPATATG